MAIPTDSFQVQAGPPATGGRHARISFPPVDPSSDADSFGDHSSIGLGPPPPLRRTSTGLEVGITGEYQTEVRRRVKSANATGAPPGRPTPLKHAQAARRKTLNAAEAARLSKSDRGRWNVASVGSSLDELEPNVFSDEYDLSHEDPKIMEDVQRALKLKLRREARLRAARANDSSVSTSSRSSPVRYSLPPLNPQAVRIAKPSLESELDFSPSVGIDRLHPVPTSTDDCATLDWGGTLVEEDKSDRKWSLSLPKRKPKDKPFPALSRDGLEKQAIAFSERISRIKSFTQPHTLKKAVITADQLQRRYAFLSNALKTEPNAGNPILTVAKWNAGLDPIVQGVLEQAEPLTWLKHLRAKRPGRTPRFPWHVTALLFEERVRAQARLAAMAMETIPEDVLNSFESPPLSRSSPEQAHPSPPFHPAFTRTSRDHLHPSLSRRRSDDGHVSFEPFVEPSRRSLDDSRHSSFYGGFFNGSRSAGTSPSSSRVYLRDLASRVRRKGASSDEASSSHPSASEDNVRTDKSRKRAGKRRHFFKPPELDLVSRTQPKGHVRGSAEADTHEERMSPPGTAVQAPREVKTPSFGDMLTPRRSLEHPQSAFQRLDTTSTMVLKVPPRTDRLLRGRASLPSSPRYSWTEEDQIDEEAEHEEYERRVELLENAIAQNQRNRYLLQRIAGGIKEYEAVQAKLSKSFGLDYTPLPPELVDAFSHDPSVVTGATRQKRGWQAVEDIHNNIARQRNAVREYLQQARRVEVPPPPSVLESPLKSLRQSLDALEQRRGIIIRKVQEVTDTLTRVKRLHATVKADYNSAMGHTSSVYPELSEIIALEERYKDRYQQLWEFGMDALTILLDSVTPFWRNYGKVIGVDAQDFLIIPWYRHEFTGEKERYPIKALPRRSFRHWVGLILFFFITLAVVVLQARAARSFSSLYRLPFNTSPGLWWISAPTFGTMAVILWTAVLVEMCIVGAQLTVVLWWVGWYAKIFD